MNGSVTEPRAWTLPRLVTVTVIATVVQAGLIYWASDRKPFHPRTAMERPAVVLAATARSELLTLTDPTIFSRAHAEGFSGPAWLQVRVQPGDPDTNAAPQQWLALASAQMGGGLREDARSHPPAELPVAFRLPPALTLPKGSEVPVLAKVSTVELKDALAKRGLIGFPPIPSQTNTDILLPSEVQVLVDARGNPISAVLLKSSGIKTADQLAVALAWGAQFTPAPDIPSRSLDDPNKGVVPGRMIFHWYTLPAPPAANGTLNPR